jgi:hypothetical protein
VPANIKTDSTPSTSATTKTILESNAGGIFPTSHGKGAGDRIDGSVKRPARKESLRRYDHDQLSATSALYIYLSESFVSSIDIIYVQKNKSGGK